MRCLCKYAAIITICMLLSHGAAADELRVAAAADNYQRGGGAIDFTNATIVIPHNLPVGTRIHTYASVLQGQVCKRLAWIPATLESRANMRINGSQSCMPVQIAGYSWPAAQAIILSVIPGCCSLAEGYVLQVCMNGSIVIEGGSELGLLYGIGRLIRLANITATQTFFSPPIRSAMIRAPLLLASYPKYAMRGHQIGYRPRTNAYDAWDVADMENYIIELALFGTNMIELLPPHTDDSLYSPLFMMDPYDMLSTVSGLVDKYGLNCSLWYPAMFGNYSAPSEWQQAVEEWERVFGGMQRLDGIFIPGGDPGSHDPATLLWIAQQQKKVLNSYHPNAMLWIGPQSWNASVLATWYNLIGEQEAASFLDGVVYGPWTTEDLPEMRAKTPSHYPMRLYPDICHSTTSQFPVWNWHYGYAMTEHRETINPRPTQQVQIAELYLPYSIGFCAYAEGINDDFNKVLWSVAAWGSDVEQENFSAAQTAITDYANVFVGSQFAGLGQDILAGLEVNWQQDPESSNAPVSLLLECAYLYGNALALRSWRTQQLLYRCYYDAIIQKQIVYDTAAERQASQILLQAGFLGSQEAMALASQLLRNASNAASWDMQLSDMRMALATLASSLFASIHMQLSVPLYDAACTEKGANFDQVGFALNNRDYILAQFASIAELPSEAQRVAALIELASWTDPGEGGYYDDLGVPSRQPHLVPGEGAQTDPQFFRTALTAFSTISSQCYNAPNDSLGPPPSFPLLPLTSLTLSKSMYDEPLQLLYPNVDPSYNYTITVVYAAAIVGQGDGPLMMLANNYLVHDWMVPPAGMTPLTFPLPPQSLSVNNTLLLACYRQWDYTQSPSHSGCAMSEIWVRRV